MKHNEKVKGNGLLPSVTRPTPKASSPFAKLLLPLVIVTALYGWHYAASHHKNQHLHLVGKNAEKAFLYVH